MNKVVFRYSIFIRCGIVLVCALLARGIAHGATSAGMITMAGAAFYLGVAILAYKVEVDAAEVRLRYFPFFTRRIPLADVTLVEERSLAVLVIPTKRVPLWGLSLKDRRALFQLLPQRSEPDARLKDGST